MKNVYIFICTILVACNSNDEQKTDSQYETFIQPRLECMNMPRPSDSYNYPIYPGTKEWATLTTGQQMLDACQVPTNILKNMSTQAVIQAIWEHPLLFEVFTLGYGYQAVFESMFSQNNAYMELSKRQDAGVALLARLNMVNPLTQDVIPEFRALELLISQTPFPVQLNNDQKKEVIDITFKNDNLLQNDAELPDSSLNKTTYRAISWLLIGRTLVAADYTPFVTAVNENNQLKYFLDGWTPQQNDIGHTGYIYMEEVYGDIPQSIISFGKDFLTIK